MILNPRLWPKRRLVLTAGWVLAVSAISSSLAEGPARQPSYQAVKPYLGLTPDISIAGLKGEFDEWLGYVDGKVYDAKAGYEYANPMVGRLYVSDHPTTLGSYYETPTHSGPIEIVAEHNGILTLRTRLGAFQKSGDEFGSGESLVRITTVTTFYFDLRHRRWLRP
jgi:hypothetical protein